MTRIKGTSPGSFYTAWRDLPLTDDGGTTMVGDFIVAHAWEKPLFERFADLLEPEGKDVLEIGFGAGLSADAIMRRGPRSHTIYELHPEVCDRARSWADVNSSSSSIRIIECTWQSAVQPEGVYDAIMFDAYSMPGCEAHDDALLFEKAALWLRPNGRLLFFNRQPYLAQATQSALLKRFDRINIHAVRGMKLSPDFMNDEGQDMMIVPVAYNSDQDPGPREAPDAPDALGETQKPTRRSGSGGGTPETDATVAGRGGRAWTRPRVKKLGSIIGAC